MKAKVQIKGKIIKSLADEFSCSRTAIREDILLFFRKDKTNAGHSNPRIKNEVRLRDGNECQYCGITDEGTYFIIEHVIPRSKNGCGDHYNLVVSCQKCNLNKRDKVWIPKNLEIITKDNPKWKEKILRNAVPQKTKQLKNCEP